MANSSDTTPPSPARPCVLVVDDDAEIGEALALVLRSAGYRPLLAANAFEAFDLFHEHRPRLVLTDWVMPGMDGLAFCAALRALPRTDPLFILMLSGYLGRLERRQASLAGADALLPKPIITQDLLHFLRCAPA